MGRRPACIAELLGQPLVCSAQGCPGRCPGSFPGMPGVGASAADLRLSLVSGGNRLTLFQVS